jgi:hypothetical protein
VAAARGWEPVAGRLARLEGVVGQLEQAVAERDALIDELKAQNAGLEAENEELKGVLPVTYQRLENDTLAALLWPDGGDVEARGALRRIGATFGRLNPLCTTGLWSGGIAYARYAHQSCRD